MIGFTSGDLFETPADIRVNTVNCVGVMGNGIALAFKTRYPRMFRDYVRACKAGEIQPGQLHIWQNSESPEIIVNFPTKRHWRHPSRYEDVEAGLVALRRFLAEHPGTRVTIPALGAGLGGLRWSQVKQMIVAHLSDLDAEIMVFSPVGQTRAEATAAINWKHHEQRHDMPVQTEEHVGATSVIRAKTGVDDGGARAGQEDEPNRQDAKEGERWSGL